MIFENITAKEVYLATLRKMSSEQKLKKACELSDFTKMLYITGLKKRFTNIGEDDLKKKLVERLQKCSNSNF
ncbi:MAG: hypothetical protein A2015_02360 [Spirochaetes bacterium GWF1_31_7]|nr:MAG: hypothetical protein A2Y30_06210 [Spirochaetes bacterium GWE1_32_154]OHD50758.1 MAG: hypothetical protein A2015_02360 [Spirochaetes bacterium GWF1_31_7]OHD51963.1 MAG: hypothetical protein A2Y29_07185 [Spirochaetes bacterium GWE2_31_10]OHD74504.1 MAG: hypothetical protein A2355_05950 [Spirochaetes bacterium RIFOXYB1_FULL_32_8]HBD95095.1 hypothetical protein [Spirochaetia bacterium]